MQKSDARIDQGALSAEHPAIMELKDQLGVVREEIRTLARMTRGAASEEVDVLKERGAHYVSEARERVEGFEEQFLEQVRNRPLRSLVIAAVVGTFLGIALRR